MSNKRKLSTSRMRHLSSYAGMHIIPDQAGWIADGDPPLAALLTTNPGLLHDLCDDCADWLVTGGWVRRTPDGHFEVLHLDGLEHHCLGEPIENRN
jgi:hypothetical protein